LSLVTAALSALELLYASSCPDWFVLLSGADYPVAQPEKVLQDLIADKVDAFVDFHELPAALSQSVDLVRENPVLPGNATLAWHRYIGFKAWVPVIRRGLRIGRYTVSLPFAAWPSPFGPDFKCFYGDHWFTGNQRTANILLRPTERHIRLRQHLRWRASPAECYYQTVLCNAPDLTLSRATRRFAKWEGGGAHPQNLGIKDLPDIMASGAHFARKFSPESAALDEIDKVLFAADRTHRRRPVKASLQN
jgi:hypothetical protein